MKNKIIKLIVDLIIYYSSAILVSFVFKRFGWIDGNIYLYSLGLTIGWTIAELIIKIFKNKSD